MMNFHTNHRNLVGVSLILFVFLSIFIAVVPAYQMQQVQPLPGQRDLSEAERKGLAVYVSENCMSCHTQQVRTIAMDRVWGDRPSMPSDYYYSKQRTDFWRQSPSLLGSERTGPDLTNIGKRQPGLEWHLLHLYNPRIVVPESIMPSYPWLFEERDSAGVSPDDILVPVPEAYLKSRGNKVVATPGVLFLVAYLQSLVQPGLPESEFLPARKNASEATVSTSADGSVLYMKTCAACHQSDGRGLPGAFPPLAGSAIVTDEDPETLIRIILQGYDARTEYGVMAAFGGQLTDGEIAALATHERSSWGNRAAPVSSEEVKIIREMLNRTSATSGNTTGLEKEN